MNRYDRTTTERGWVWLVTATALVVIAGCTSDTEPASADTTEPETVETTTPLTAPLTTEASPKPSPTKSTSPQLTIKQAGDRCQEIVAPTNAAAMEAMGYRDAERWREACELFIEPMRTMVDNFLAERWPGDAQRVVTDQLVPLLKDEIAAYESCASSSNDQRAEDIYWSDAYHAYEAVTPVANTVRTLLNLPAATS